MSSIRGLNIRFPPHTDYLNLHVKDPFVVAESQNEWKPFLAKKIVTNMTEFSFLRSSDLEILKFDFEFVLKANARKILMERALKL